MWWFESPFLFKSRFSETLECKCRHNQIPVEETTSNVLVQSKAPWWQQTLFQYLQLFPMMCFPWEGVVFKWAWGWMGTLSLTSLQNVYKVPNHMIHQLTLLLATCGETVCVSHGRRKITRFFPVICIKTDVSSGDLEREQIINHFMTKQCKSSVIWSVYWASSVI